MSKSLEVRVPFLDTAFAEALFKYGDESVRRGEKALLKQSVSDLVPQDVLERKKSGFVFPFSYWLDDELADVVDRALKPDRLQNASLNPTAARYVREQFREGEVHWKRLWGVVVLSLWVDRHIPE
jgi:asparagine synthase (glutamine-hydrolysing)